jgi:hypothetical protein
MRAAPALIYRRAANCLFSSRLNNRTTGQSRMKYTTAAATMGVAL